MKKINTFVKQNKIFFIIIFTLLISNFLVYISLKEKENEILYMYRAVPNISLGYTLDGADEYYFGEIKGFVKFLKEEDQPKGARQYYIIRPSLDSNYKTSYFTAETIYSFNYTSPQSIGIDKLDIIENNSSMLTLTDPNGNKFLINKINKQVKMVDTDGDTVEFITNDSDYKKYVINKIK